jgi:hypothetical protein
VCPMRWERRVNDDAELGIFMAEMDEILRGVLNGIDLVRTRKIRTGSKDATREQRNGLDGGLTV